MSPFNAKKTNISSQNSFTLIVESIDKNQVQEEYKVNSSSKIESSDFSSSDSRSNQEDQNQIDLEIDSQYDPARQLEIEIEVD